MLLKDKSRNKKRRRRFNLAVSASTPFLFGYFFLQQAAVISALVFCLLLPPQPQGQLLRLSLPSRELFLQLRPR